MSIDTTHVIFRKTESGKKKHKRRMNRAEFMKVWSMKIRQLEAIQSEIIGKRVG